MLNDIFMALYFVHFDKNEHSKNVYKAWKYTYIHTQHKKFQLCKNRERVDFGRDINNIPKIECASSSAWIKSSITFSYARWESKEEWEDRFKAIYNGITNYYCYYLLILLSVLYTKTDNSNAWVRAEKKRE